MLKSLPSPFVLVYTCREWNSPLSRYSWLAWFHIVLKMNYTRSLGSVPMVDYLDVQLHGGLGTFFYPLSKLCTEVRISVFLYRPSPIKWGKVDWREKDIGLKSMTWQTAFSFGNGLLATRPFDFIEDCLPTLLYLNVWILDTL